MDIFDFQYFQKFIYLLLRNKNIIAGTSYSCELQKLSKNINFKFYFVFDPYLVKNACEAVSRFWWALRHRGNSKA